MKLSVVISCRNAAATLGRALVSVLEQGFADMEILVVDEGSTDGTVALAERLGERIADFELISLAADIGRGAARNAGLARARGECVVFLDAEDAYGAGVFAKVIADLDTYMWADGIEFGVRLADAQREVQPLQQAVIANSLAGNIILRRAFVEAIGGFPDDGDFRAGKGDADSAFRLAVRRWGTVGATSQATLEHTIQPGDAFDKFLATSRVVDGRLEMASDDETQARSAATSAYLRRVDAAMFRSIGEPARHAIHCDMGGRQFDFEIPDRPEMIGEATAALANTGYPALPFLGPVQTVLEVGAGPGAGAVYHAGNNPNARVIALEPTRRGFVLLRGNAFAHANIETYCVGLYDATTRLDLMDHGGASHERVLMAQAAAFLSSLRLEQIDILNMDNRGCEVAALYALAPYLPKTKSIMVRYYRDTDRRLIDAMLTPTHLLYWGRSTQPNQGQFLYVRRALLGPDGER